MKSVALAIEEPSPRGIAAGIARLITSGDLAPGDRLPTVRALAADLGVSPATVSHAWQTLAANGLILSRGRSGSVVRSTPKEWLPLRYRGMEGDFGARLDLSRGTPDPALLPDLMASLGRLSGRADTANYLQKPDIPELHDLLRDTWPAPAEALTVTNGALDAIDRVLARVTRFGDRIVVENPTFPPFFDLIDHYGLQAVPVELDDEGMIPAAFTAALGSAPTAVLLQPRAHNPSGTSMTAARAQELSGILRRSRTAPKAIVIEDDHSGSIAAAPIVSLATWLPERTLHVRSYSKSHGPDLRIGALGGPRELVERVIAHRLLGPGWTSRMMQSVLYDLLTNPDAVGQVANARAVYAQRQSAFAEAMAGLGVPVHAGDGLNAWLAVADERTATVRLAAAGIQVAPGSPFQFGAGSPHVRVTVGLLDGEIETIAGALAAAARG
jgi:DNA-binding transcriptional MocR family regulator